MAVGQRKLHCTCCIHVLVQHHVPAVLCHDVKAFGDVWLVILRCHFLCIVLVIILVIALPLGVRGGWANQARQLGGVSVRAAGIFDLEG